MSDQHRLIKVHRRPQSDRKARPKDRPAHRPITKTLRPSMISSTIYVTSTIASPIAPPDVSTTLSSSITLTLNLTDQTTTTITTKQYKRSQNTFSTTVTSYAACATNNILGSTLSSGEVIGNIYLNSTGSNCSILCVHIGG